MAVEVLRNRSVTRVVVIAVALAVCIPVSVHAQPPQTFVAGSVVIDNSFATLTMPKRPAYLGPDTVLDATLRLKPTAGLGRAYLVLIGFDTRSDGVGLTFEPLGNSTGSLLPVWQDERDDPRTPRLWFAPTALPVGEDLHVRAKVTAETNGQLYVGLLAIAFDVHYGTLQTDAEEPAVVYGASLFRANDVEGAVPFAGTGNAWPLGALVLVAVISTGVALWTNRPRRT